MVETTLDLSVEEEDRLLAMVDIMQPLPSHEMRWLARRTTVARREPGETFDVGEDRRRLIILVSGRVRVYEPDPRGQDLTLSVVEGGTIVGQSGFAVARSRKLRVETLEPSVVRVLGWEDLEDLIRRNPEVGIELIRLLSARLGVCEDRLSDLVRKEVPARLAGLVLKLSEHQGRHAQRRSQDTHPLHPPATRHHDRSQPGGGYACVGKAKARGERGGQGSPHPRHGRRGPGATRRIEAVSSRKRRRDRVHQRVWPCGWRSLRLWRENL